MKVLVTGGNGQLGQDVAASLRHRDIQGISVDKNDFSITEAEQTQKYIQSSNPDVVIHCAAYTAVDKAEDDRTLCHAVNVLGTRHIAQACRALNARMIYVSTDYVFDGKGSMPYDTEDRLSPINYYGMTKLQGELEVKKVLNKFHIVRTSWVFGMNGSNFVKTMLRLGKERKELKVVCDQIGSPTYSKDLAELLVSMCVSDRYGIYHATNEGVCSWYEFAKEIFELAGMDVALSPILSEEYPTRAVRPKNSRMSKESLDRGGFQRLPHWKDSLKRYLDELLES